jgi:hypothetical protein
MSETLRRPLALLLLAACPVIGAAGLRACAASPAAATVVAIGTQAGSPDLPAPLCAGCWG